MYNQGSFSTVRADGALLADGLETFRSINIDRQDSKMTKRPRDNSPIPASLLPSNKQPLKLISSLPSPLRILSADPAVPTPAEDNDATTVHHLESNVTVYFSPEEISSDLKSGTKCELYVAEPELYFWIPSSSENQNAKGLAIPYKVIAIHAVSRGSSDAEDNKPCIYLQLTSKSVIDEAGRILPKPQSEGAADEEEDDEETDPRYDDEDEMVEIRVVPEDSSSRGLQDGAKIALRTRPTDFLSRFAFFEPIAYVSFVGHF